MSGGYLRVGEVKGENNFFRNMSPTLSNFLGSDRAVKKI